MRRLTLLVVVAALVAGCGSARPPTPSPTPSPTLTPAPTPSPTPAPARCDLWAAPGGSDSAAGTKSAPLATPQALANRLTAGQTGCLRGGTYVERGELLLSFDHGGAPGAPLTIRSAPGERATLRGIVYVPPGADHVVLSGLTFDARHPDGAVSVGIQIMATDTVIQGSVISNAATTTSCMLLGTEAGAQATGTVIRDNLFHDCGSTSDGMLDHAIYVEAATGTRITDNVFVRTAGWAVHLYPDARNSVVTGNVMWDGGGGVVFAGDGAYASSGNRVVGNVIGGSRRRPELVSSWGSRIGRGNVAAGNCLLPGLAASEHPPEGFASRGNTIVRPATAAAAASCPGRLGQLAGAALGS